MLALRASAIQGFRLISLIDSIYIVLAKVMYNRLKGKLLGLINQTQGALIAGRQILDCLLIDNEILDCTSQLKVILQGLMIVQVGISG